MDREVSVSNPCGVEVFCSHKEKLIYTKDHELNYLACRSRTILPTFVGLCLSDQVFRHSRLAMLLYEECREISGSEEGSHISYTVA